MRIAEEFSVTRQILRAQGGEDLLPALAALALAEQWSEVVVSGAGVFELVELATPSAADGATKVLADAELLALSGTIRAGEPEPTIVLRAAVSAAGTIDSGRIIAAVVSELSLVLDVVTADERASGSQPGVAAIPAPPADDESTQPPRSKTMPAPAGGSEAEKPESGEEVPTPVVTVESSSIDDDDEPSAPSSAPPEAASSSSPSVDDDDQDASAAAVQTVTRTPSAPPKPVVISEEPPLSAEPLSAPKPPSCTFSTKPIPRRHRIKKPLPEEEEDVSGVDVGDFLDHPQLGLCEVVGHDGGNTIILVPSGRKRSLRLNALRLGAGQEDEQGRRIIKVLGPRRGG